MNQPGGKDFPQCSLALMQSEKLCLHEIKMNPWEDMRFLSVVAECGVDRFGAISN